MSFSKKTDKLVKDLIDSEYENACCLYGDKYQTLHQAYSVLAEEIDEVKSELLKLLSYKQEVKVFTQNFDANKDFFDLYNICHSSFCVSKHAIKELAQVCAVLKKFQATLDSMKDNI